jgi:hypothetical protein
VRLVAALPSLHDAPPARRTALDAARTPQEPARLSRAQGALLAGYVDGHLRATRPQTIGWRWVPAANDAELAHLEPAERTRLLARGAVLDRRGLMVLLREIEAASPE